MRIRASGKRRPAAAASGPQGRARNVFDDVELRHGAAGTQDAEHIVLRVRVATSRRKAHAVRCACLVQQQFAGVHGTSRALGEPVVRSMVTYAA